MPVFVDRQLAADERIVFQAGRHTDTVEMAYADFARLVHPLVGDFC
jgi:Ala-tRNA(Pro) deacylase